MLIPDVLGLDTAPTAPPAAAPADAMDTDAS